jgi:cobaltochelatase CobS
MGSSTKQFSVRESFGIDVPPEITVTGNAEANSFVPAVDQTYRFGRENLSDVLAWLQHGDQDALYLSGPTGSGKSSLICQIAARLNIPVQRVTAHSRLEVPELIGHHTVVDGDMVYVDGPLTTAMRYGHIFLLDEIDLLDPATAAGMNGIVEGGPLVIPENGGEVVTPHPQFRFVATGNTAGAGDRSGLYQGALRQNLAFMDRFWMVVVGYPDPVQEGKILEAAVPSLPQPIREKMIEVANTVRKLFMGEGDGDGNSIEVTMSTRTLIRWAYLTNFFKGLRAQGVNPISHALDRALALKASPETRQALHEIVQREMGDQ